MTLGPSAWLLISLDDGERQYAGNAGYADEVRTRYLYDSNVQNSKRMRPGDLAVLRAKELLGVARIVAIDESPGKKELRTCPRCGRSAVQQRSRVTPRYRCMRCHETFDEPTINAADVVHYVALFGGTFVATPAAVPMEALRAACLSYTNQLAMQRIDLTSIAPMLVRAHPEVASLLFAIGWPANVESYVLPIGPEPLVADFDPSRIEDVRRRMERSVAIRQGQPEFRSKLLQAYEGRCAITGCDVGDALEAAHILPYRGDDSHHVQNGLLLRADLHLLFDRGRMGVDPHTWRVVLEPSIRTSHYASIHDHPMRLPVDPTSRPSIEALDLHLRAIRAGS